MRFTRRKKLTTTGALAAAVLLSAGSLTACGGEEDAADPGSDMQDMEGMEGTEGTEGDQGPVDMPDMEGSEALEEMRVTAEEAGYQDCMLSPASDDMETVSLACYGGVDQELPRIVLFDTADRASGVEAAEAERDFILEQPGMEDGDAQLAGKFRPLDGDGVAGFCDAESGDCDGVVGELGLDIGELDEEPAQG